MSTRAPGDPPAAGKRAATMAVNRERLVTAARRAFARDGYAAASMDALTAEAGLTRGALYHGFGDKKGLLWAVVAQVDAEMAQRLAVVRARATNEWQSLLDEGVAYIEMALEPEIQRIMLLDGPAVLGDPSRWPGESACVAITTRTIQSLVDQGVVQPVDAEAAGRLVNGAALSAALWVAAAEHPKKVLAKAIDAYQKLVSGLLETRRPR